VRIHKNVECSEKCSEEEVRNNINNEKGDS